MTGWLLYNVSIRRFHQGMVLFESIYAAPPRSTNVTDGICICFLGTGVMRVTGWNLYDVSIRRFHQGMALCGSI